MRQHAETALEKRRLLPAECGHDQEKSKPFEDHRARYHKPELVGVNEVVVAEESKQELEEFRRVHQLDLEHAQPDNR